MKRVLVFFGGAVALLVGLASAMALIVSMTAPARAQQPECLARVDLVIRLNDRYGEARVSIGLDGRGNVIETWANAETGTWTVTFTDTNGCVGILSYGEAFERIDEALTPTGVPL